MRNFQDSFETRKRAFISAFSIYMTLILNLKTTRMVLSNGSNVFKITLIPQWRYFLLVRKIRPFSHEKVVITQSDAWC